MASDWGASRRMTAVLLAVVLALSACSPAGKSEETAPLTAALPEAVESTVETPLSGDPHPFPGAPGWPAVAGDMIIYPIGLVEEPGVPHLLALRLKQ